MAWPRRGRRGGLHVVAVAVVIGCSPGSPTATALPPGTTAPTEAAGDSPLPTAAPTRAVVPLRLDETLALADGREIKARCVGEGTPTILLEAGGSNDMTDWAPQFVNALGEVTTTCLYSRAGGPGSSPPAARPPTMASVTSDAFEVLELARSEAGVEGPYLFVGWSLGGSVALANALTRPDQTVGIAILDTDFPGDFLAICADQGRTEEDCQAEFDQDIDAKFMEAEIARAVNPLDLPAVLVTAMEYPDCQEAPGATLSASVGGTIVVAADCAGLAAAVADRQIAAWGAALPEIDQVRVAANHDGLVDSEGRQIADLILDIVEAARAPS